MDLIGSVLPFEITANLFDEIRSQRVGIVRQMQHERYGTCLVSLGRGDFTVFEHGVDDQVAALHGAIRMIDRRIVGRPLGSPASSVASGRVSCLAGLAEVKLGCGFKSVHAMAKSNLVGIEREDLRLGETPLDLDGEHGFLHFALPAAVGREEQIAGELHCQRGCTLHLAAGLDIAISGAGDAEEVDSGVAIEVLVFGGYQSIPQDQGKIVVVGDDAALQRERSNHCAVIIVDLCDGAGAIGFEGVYLR